MPETPPPPRLVEALSDRYRIRTLLGEGGMATVYLAEDLKHDRRVAIKVLKPELAAVLGAERFLSEIRTTAKLQHPHILPLFDSGEADGLLYYVMPYVEGESLRDRMDREGPLPIDEAVRIVQDAAEALDYAHRQGILHRDIKPANLLLQEGRVLVADFGIALALSHAGEGRMTETGLSLGTPHYMSPEQAGADRDLGPRSDLYSLACVLYEALAGQPPHTGPSSQAVLVRILTDDPPELSSLRRSVPRHLEDAVRKALEKLPADRFASPAEFARTLGDPSFRYGSSSGAGSAAVRGERGGKRILVPILLALVAATSVLALAGWLRSPRSDEVAVVRLTLDAEGSSILPGSLDISPDGSTVVIATEDGLASRRLGEELLRLLPGTEGAVLPLVSADGEWVVFGQEGDIRRTPLEGGLVTTLLAGSGPQSLFQGHLGPDGSTVAIGPAGYFLVGPEGGEPRNLIDVYPDIRAARLVAGGSKLIFTDPSAFDLKLLDLVSDSVMDLGLRGQRPRVLPSGHLMAVRPDGTLFVVPFDVESGRTTGPIELVAEGIQVDPNNASYAVSDNGVLVFGRGPAGYAPDVQLVRHDLASGAIVDTVPVPLALYEDGRFSPEGDRLALETRLSGMDDTQQIHLLDLITLTRTQLTFEGDNHHPRWSPDGRTVAFASEREGTLLEDIWAKDADGLSPARPIWTEPLDQHVFDWYSDTLMVLGDPELGRTGGLQLIALGDSTREVQRLRGDWFESWMDVSPGGRYAVYSSSELGAGEEVFIRSFPGEGGKWRISEGGGTEPSWSADGGTVYYEDPNGPWLMEADVRLAPTPVVLETRRVVPLGGTTFWALDPGGEQVLVGRLAAGLSGDAELSSDLQVVLGWDVDLGMGSGRAR